MIKLTKKIGCDKMVLCSGKGKTFWATLLESFFAQSFFRTRNAIPSVWQDAVFGTRVFPNGSKLMKL